MTVMPYDPTFSEEELKNRISYRGGSGGTKSGLGFSFVDNSGHLEFVDHSESASKSKSNCPQTSANSNCPQIKTGGTFLKQTTNPERENKK